MTGSLFCFGLGYSARVLALRLKAKGWRVGGTARSARGLEEIQAMGITAWPFDNDRPLPDEALDGVTHILSSVPPEDGRDLVLERCTGLLLSRQGSLRWAGYLSTTGVYGNTNGAEVDEGSPTNPSSERTHWRVAAEKAWLALADRLPVQVFRLSGIYGPGRSVLDELRAGRARRLTKPGQVFSRIHVEDIARTLEASMARPRPGTIYNLADDEPAPSADLVAYAARLLGVEPPPMQPYDQAGLSPMALSFWADNRRVTNRRIKEELGVTLGFPTYREGLDAIFAATEADRHLKAKS